MEKLPLEVLRQILSYLNSKQRLDAGLVCKLWLYASKPLLEDVVLTVEDGHLPHVNSGRTLKSIRVTKTAIDDYCIHFLNHLEPLHLQFSRCVVPKSPSANCFETVDCSELQTLETDSSDVLSLFQYSPSLKTLILTYAEDVNAETLENGEFIGLGLKSFSMPLLLPYNDESSQSGQEFLIDPKLILLSLEKFVRMKAETLKIVEFPKKISAHAVLSISQIEHLKLESVTFPNCSDCGTAIVDFCQNQSSITDLNLRYPSSILSDEDFCKIFQLLPALREFSVADSSTLDSSIVRLFARPTMRLIRLYNCDLITPESFSAAIKNLACFDLRDLALFDTQLQDNHILRLLPLLPRLESLNLSRCSLSNERFHEATLRLTSLRSLRLKECNGLSGHTLSHLTGLTNLNLSECKGLTLEGLLEGVKFLNLKFLLIHNSSFPSNMSDSIKLELIKQNPHLSEDFIYIF